MSRNTTSPAVVTPTTNPNPNSTTFPITFIDNKGKELKQLEQDFDFKGNYEIAREINAEHLAYALNRHGNKK